MLRHYFAADAAFAFSPALLYAWLADVDAIAAFRCRRFRHCLIRYTLLLRQLLYIEIATPPYAFSLLLLFMLALISLCFSLYMPLRYCYKMPYYAMITLRRYDVVTLTLLMFGAITIWLSLLMPLLCHADAAMPASCFSDIAIRRY